MRALRVGLTLALGTGLGAAAEGWRRQRADARPAPGLLGRLPVLPVAAAAELPVVPAVPGAPVGGGPGELAKYGLPGLAQLKSRESYVLCYDPRTRGALWVVEQLRPERLRGDGDRSSCDFREDDSVHAYHRATNADYRGSGFDRGHLAAAANHRWSQKAMDDTFYLSNVAPQVAPAPGPDCTRRGAPPQPECLEQPGEVQPELDPHLPKRLCLHRATLPAQVLILEAAGGQIELRSYVMPNAPVDEAIPLERFLVPIESIERASGLLFVPNILARAGSFKAISAGSK
ncbi:endonuclease G, mitochondrial isoform X2 [Pteropus vampyrus]|uniref:Endonuclease n=1 Tax=Pteropus vampyrus TaxID=132908 RepID=A0A6P6CN35_PTEVA|nr:endonuclease G, mitochondrial isoform X2 [Pteropus vampyrus]